MGNFELTAAQTAIWLDHVFFSDKPIYNTGQVVTISGTLDERDFIEAIHVLVRESDALRLAITIERGAPRQEVRAVLLPDVELVDFSAVSEPEAAARAWIEEWFWTVLHWHDFPLFRFALIKLAYDRTLWLQKYHHLVIDATGRQLITKRVAQIYEAQRNGTAPEASTAAPFALSVEAETEYRKSARYDDDRDYWLARFSDLPASLIEGDRRQTERSKSGRPSRLSFRIGRDAFARLEALAKAEGSTLFKVIVALVYLTIGRLYDAHDLAFGIPLANRMGKFKETIGLFSQVMAFRINVARDETFAATLKQIDRMLTRDYAHRRFPIGSLKSLSRPGRVGLYDVSINYVPTDYTFDFARAPLAVANISSGFFTPWAITIADLGAESGLDVIIDYDSGLIEESKANRLAQCLHFLLLNGIGDVNRPIAELPIEPAQEWHK